MSPLDTKSELEAAIHDLYRVFQPYQLGPDFTGCDHCVDPRDTAHLAETPLLDLTLHDLNSYSFNALTTWGKVPHFKHFLPRLFELAAAEPDEFLDVEVLFGKLAHGKWHEWPEAERQGVDRFLQSYWAAELSRDVDGERDIHVDTALCALGQVHHDLSPFLTSWITTDSNSACRQLAHYFLLNYHNIVGHRELRNAFWYGQSTQAAQVFDWLRSPAVYEFLYDRQERLEGRLSMAIPLLAEWQCGPVGK